MTWMWKNQERFFSSLGKNRIFQLGLILVLYLGLALWKLDELPGEWYGDISNVHEYVTQIQNGERSFYFLQSIGPLYHYLILPIVSVAGQNYLGYKLASVAVGLLGIIAIYFMADEVAGAGSLTALVASISFWFLVWSRLGNSQIIIPPLSAMAIYYGKKYLDSGRWKFLTAGTVMSLTGWLVYPQTLILPAVFFLWVILRKDLLKTLIYVMVVVVAGGVFFRTVGNFGNNGYVSSKIPTKGQLVSWKWGENIIKTLGMFHVRGDVIFRGNVSQKPHLDPISGTLFILGILVLGKKHKKLSILLLLSGLILILPSTSPALPDSEIPSSGRTVGVIPIVMLLVAQGIRVLGKRWRMAAVLGAILLLNLHEYFVEYPQGLPNHNVAYGKIIGGYIDGLPDDTVVKLANCCWGEWGQPEPKGIYHQLIHKKNRESMEEEKYIQDCNQVPERGRFAIIFGPDDSIKMDLFSKCREGGKRRVGSIFQSLVWE